MVEEQSTLTTLPNDDALPLMEGYWLRDLLAAWFMIAFGWESRCRQPRTLWVSALECESPPCTHVRPRGIVINLLSALTVSDRRWGCTKTCRTFVLSIWYIKNFVEITDSTQKNLPNHVLWEVWQGCVSNARPRWVSKWGIKIRGQGNGI